MGIAQVPSSHSIPNMLYYPWFQLLVSSLPHFYARELILPCPTQHPIWSRDIFLFQIVLPQAFQVLAYNTLSRSIVLYRITSTKRNDSWWIQVQRSVPKIYVCLVRSDVEQQLFQRWSSLGSPGIPTNSPRGRNRVNPVWIFRVSN